MNTKSILTVFLTTTVLYGCSSKDPAAVVKISGLNLPANVEVLQDDAASEASLAAVNNAAYNSIGTDFTNAKADEWIDGGNWQDPIKMADMLICIMNGTGADKMPNSTYKAWVNMTLCDNDQGSSQKGKKTRFAESIVTSARVSNTSNQIVEAYFTDGQDQNNDNIISEAENSKYVGSSTMFEQASASNPYGVFSFDWNKDDAVADGQTGDWERGSLTLSNENTTQVGFKFIEEIKDQGESENYTRWANGVLNKDGSGGKLKVSDGANSIVYKIHFNATHANIDTAGASVCKNLDESSMTTYVYRYNLFDSSTGALKDIKAGLQFKHGSGKSLRGYAGSYVDENGTVKQWVWTEDGSAPTTIYKESDVSVSYSVTWSSGQPTISGMTFDPRIEIDASFTGVTPGGVSGTKTDNLDYEGPGQLWGINWALTGDVNGNGQCDNSEKPGASPPGTCTGDWTPDYNIANGTSLTDTSGTVWKIKQMGLWKTLATVNASFCSALPVTDAIIAYTSPTLRAVALTFTDKPTVTGKPSIIHGVKQ